MTSPHVDVIWLPVGAGGHVAIHTSRWWEWWQARRERRPPQRLFHAALEVFDGCHRHAIEMAPAWTGPAGDRGTVATGPVGCRWLGRFRLFRYEVRCRRDGIIPDRAWAVGAPTRLSVSAAAARALIARVPDAPLLVWGRDPFDSGDMWNSNSLVSWLLRSAGIDAGEISPPPGGLAPGWRSGILAAGIH